MSSLPFFLLLISIISIFTQTQSNADHPLVLSLAYSDRSNDFPTPPKTRSAKQTSQDIDVPLTEITDGFIMSIHLGTPPQLIQNVIFDTGSDLVWVPCGKKFECKECRYTTDMASIFYPDNSTSLVKESCSSPLCHDLHSSQHLKGCCKVNRKRINPCLPFVYKYGDGDVQGDLRKDFLGVYEDNSKNSKISFGCVRWATNEPYGIAGFGKGPLSLPSQLGLMTKSFSHCFLPFKFSGNSSISTPLILGDLPTSSEEHLQFTPMLENKRDPNNYYIGLEAITVSGLPPIRAPLTMRKIDSSGDGGMLIDSGTTYTHLPEPLYSKLISDLKSKIQWPRATDFEDRFDLCYIFPIPTNITQIPSITLDFTNNVSLTLAQETYFYKMARPQNSTQVNCLLFQNGSDGVFGSFQQQNVKVVYDLGKKRIGFQQTDCVSYAKYQGLHKI